MGLGKSCWNQSFCRKKGVWVSPCKLQWIPLIKLEFGEKEFNGKFQVNPEIPLWNILKLPINVSMLLGAGCTLSHGCLVLMWDCQKDQQSVTDLSAFKNMKKPTLFLSLPVQLIWQDNLFSVSCLIGAWRSNWAIGAVAFLYLFTHLCFSVTITLLRY